MTTIELFEEVTSTPKSRIWIAETIEDAFVGTPAEIAAWAKKEFGSWRIGLLRWRDQ